ncbi:MAG: Magnesium transport protein CorA [Acetothermia bacterium 64_32]|nr:MAG: Magnesium transport protein CorA [Acetothermia bacterium 64_32]HAF71444.1 magnesium and cobalt transport protein CorA [Candidatus Acetothermia bacterium]
MALRFLKPVRGRARKAGTPPGTLPEGLPEAGEVSIRLIAYSHEKLAERELPPEGIRGTRPQEGVLWLDIIGHDRRTLAACGEAFGLHPLLLEDIATPGQRPKLEDYGDFLFLVLSMLKVGQEDEVEEEQVSFVLGPSWLISVQEREGDVFEPVRERIRAGKGRIRGEGADYLLYSLVDAVVDGYFLVLESLGEGLEGLEEEVLGAPVPETAAGIHRLKRELLFVRKGVWPLRETIGGLLRLESPLISNDTRPFLRDVYDHTIQVIDTVETLRDMVTGLLDIYLTSVSNRMNEVMKVLTVIATLFMPLTFIAGIYGMNFQYMPELSWRWGYFGVLGLMALLALGMLVYFRRKRWL